MATSYILPASAMTHGHHGHGHSHSHSPARSQSTNASRSIRPDRPRGGALHTYSYSEALHEYSDRGQDAGSLVQKQPYTAGPSGLSEEHIPSPISPYDPPRIDTDLPPHNHSHHGHHGHHDHHDHDDHDGHDHHVQSPINVVTVQPRSRFTSFILPFVLRWPLLHSIMADKDSRRIFYFMR